MDKINNIGLSRLMTSVYDFNGFTEQEIWCRIAQKINIIIEHFNYIDNKIDNEKENNKIKLDYLLGEGLELSIAKKVQKMYDDGTLANIINISIFNILNNKIDDIIKRLEILEGNEE